MLEKFGNRTVLRTFIAPQPNGKNRRMAECRCTCGDTSIIRYDALLTGKSMSCIKCAPKPAKTHGYARANGTLCTEYRSWQKMRDRCLNPNATRYERWGGRGITICPQWDDFAVFLADMGPKPTSRHSLERLDNDGPYCPENCRWASPKEQSRNTRRNRLITFNGETLTVAEWAERTGINRRTIEQRDKNGWSAKDTLTPVPYKK